MHYNNILQTIFSDHLEYIQYVLRPGKNVLDNINKMIHCHDPSFGGAFFVCLIVGTLNLSLFPVKAVSVLPVATCIIRNGLFVCPVNWFPAFTGIVSLPFLKNSASFFLRTIPFLTACFIRSGMSSCVCSSSLTSPKTLLLALSASCIPSGGI